MVFKKDRRIPMAGKAFSLALAGVVAAGTAAQAEYGVGFNLYGAPGLVDMPTAEMPADGTISTTISRFGENTRSTLTFQIAPRISGSFRYSGIGEFNHPDSVDGVFYDRSFDLRFQVFTEGTYRPAVR